MAKSKIVNVFGKMPVTSPKPHDIWIIPNEFVGVEVELEGYRKRAAIPGWEVKADGSLRGPSAEFVTAGPQSGGALYKCITELCATAVANGYETSVRTAIHVHLNFSGPEDDFDDVRHMLAAYLMFEKMLFKFAGEYRRWVGFTYAFEDADGNFDQWRDLFTAEDERQLALAARACDRYAGLNVLALVNHGTLEFRHLPTTFDSTRIVTWINLLLCLRKLSRKLKDENLDIIQLYKDRGHKQFLHEVFVRDELIELASGLVNEDDLRHAMATIRGLQVTPPKRPAIAPNERGLIPIRMPSGINPDEAAALVVGRVAAKHAAPEQVSVLVKMKQQSDMQAMNVGRSVKKVNIL